MEDPRFSVTCEGLAYSAAGYVARKCLTATQSDLDDAVRTALKEWFELRSKEFTREELEGCLGVLAMRHCAEQVRKLRD